MAHCYASVSELKDFIRDQGSASAAGLGTANDALFLAWLEEASRSIDDYCRRTGQAHPMSGFGPRVGTNRYDGSGTNCLELADDLLSLTSLTTLPAIGGTPITLTAETDYYLEPYDRPPYRRIVLHEVATTTLFYAVRRGVSAAGTWAYSNETAASITTVASGLAADAAATTFTTSATPTIEIGHTLLIGSEQVYVTGLSGTTATITRGANGTTAAVHADTSAIAVYRYPRQVKVTSLRLAHRRWKARDAGLTGAFGDGQMPVTSHGDTELSIHRNGVWMYHLIRVN